MIHNNVISSDSQQQQHNSIATQKVDELVNNTIVKIKRMGIQWRRNRFLSKKRLSLFPVFLKVKKYIVKLPQSNGILLRQSY